jgi:hypothetical protein
LGEDQWHWLDTALKVGVERNTTLTLIGAGVQIITDRFLTPVESFTWKNKQRLFELFKKNKVGQLILMSGDVHYA